MAVVVVVVYSGGGFDDDGCHCRILIITILVVSILRIYLNRNVTGDIEVYEDKPLKIGVVHQSAPHMCVRRIRLRSKHCHSAALPPHPTNPQPNPDTPYPLLPCMYAHILELLQVRPGHRVLNIGSGTGYLSLLFAWFAGPNGSCPHTPLFNIIDVCS